MNIIVLGLTVFLAVSTTNGQENNPFHFASDFLSDENPGSKEYDHEAFLGEDMADEFDDLVPEESQKRLGWAYLNGLIIELNNLYYLVTTSLTSDWRNGLRPPPLVICLYLYLFHTKV